MTTNVEIMSIRSVNMTFRQWVYSSTVISLMDITIDSYCKPGKVRCIWQEAESHLEYLLD